jgi:trans-aconitate methyltransferase
MAEEGISYEYREATHEVSHSYLLDPVKGLLADVPAGARVLDLGCGNGSFISLFQDRGWKPRVLPASTDAIMKHGIWERR